MHYALCIAFAAFAANAADLFVSASGTWVPDGREGTCHTDLRFTVGRLRAAYLNERLSVERR